MVGIQLQLATGMHIMHVPPGQLKDSRARPSPAGQKYPGTTG